MDIRQIVREEIALSRQQAGYGTTLVPFHKHNGIDSPQLEVNNIKQFMFFGNVTAVGGIGFIFPNGWTLSTDGTTLVSTITHNLNTTNYIVLTTSVNANLLNPTNPQIDGRTSTQFKVIPRPPGSANGSAEGFNFILFLTTPNT
ncbi:MAG: hypothetical protein KGJ90_02110 [Patescibacteria group bacterium]|nr:hypothetical protein [Patescibacteria group bacterium]